LELFLIRLVDYYSLLIEFFVLFLLENLLWMNSTIVYSLPQSISFLNFLHDFIRLLSMKMGGSRVWLARLIWLPILYVIKPNFFNILLCLEKEFTFRRFAFRFLVDFSFTFWAYK